MIDHWLLSFGYDFSALWGPLLRLERALTRLHDRVDNTPHIQEQRRRSANALWMLVSAINPSTDPEQMLRANLYAALESIDEGSSSDLRCMAELHLALCERRRIQGRPGRFRRGPRSGPPPGSVDPNTIIGPILSWFHDPEGGLLHAPALRVGVLTAVLVITEPFESDAGLIPWIWSRRSLTELGLDAGGRFDPLENLWMAESELRHAFATARVHDQADFTPFLTTFTRSMAESAEEALRRHEAQSPQTLPDPLPKIEAPAIGQQNTGDSQVISPIVTAPRGYPARYSILVLELPLGATLTPASYRQRFNISTATATRDLKTMVDTGLLLPQGHGASRSYLRVDPLM